MKFYEVHDEDGCLSKMRNFEVAKQTALVYLTMKSDRKMRIKICPDNPQRPITSIRLDPATRTWSKPERLSFRRPVVASAQDDQRGLSAGL